MDPTIQKPESFLKGKYVSDLYEKFEDQIHKIQEEEEKEAMIRKMRTQKAVEATTDKVQRNPVKRSRKEQPKKFIDVESDYEKTMNEQLEVISDEESPSKMGVSYLNNVAPLSIKKVETKKGITMGKKKALLENTLTFDEQKTMKSMIKDFNK